VRARIGWIIAIVALVAAPAALYRLLDPERLDLDESVRRATPGQFARLTDGYTHYEVGGPPAAPVVVLAAGFSVPYYIWDPTFKALTDAGFRVVRYDYFGRGFSDRPDTPYTQAFYVRQLTELLQATGMTGTIDLVGLSLGAAVTTSFADAYPDRVRSLIYVDPAFRTPGPPPPFASTPLLWDLLTVLGDQRTWADDQKYDFHHPERFPDWPERYRVQMRYRGFRRARLSELTANAAVDQTEEIERVGRHPRSVLVIWGKQDLSAPFESSDALLDAMPRARLVAVDDAGHLPQWEQPEITHSEMTTFLRGLR
jgi:pimeloyl-ACP methyl ester carboxylesterase